MSWNPYQQAEVGRGIYQQALYGQPSTPYPQGAPPQPVYAQPQPVYVQPPPQQQQVYQQPPQQQQPVYAQAPPPQYAPQPQGKSRSQRAVAPGHIATYANRPAPRARS